jgi:enamine deaminase RidA (YjgF/YER057c/UK114 family)
LEQTISAGAEGSGILTEQTRKEITMSDGSAVEARLHELGFELPLPPPAVGNYVGAVAVGELVFVSGHGPVRDGELIYRGKLGQDMDVETGQKAAELVILNALASLREEIGSLDRVRRIVKLFGMVNSTPDFVEQPKVIDGASNLLTTVFGEKGRHARAAVGFVSLPYGIAVEIEMVVEVE